MCSVYTTPRSHPIFTQSRVWLADLPPFERAVVVVTSCWATAKKILWGHAQLEELSVCWIWASAATRRAFHCRYDGTAGWLPAPCRPLEMLWTLQGYGKNALLLSLLAYNVGVGRLLGYGKHPKSRLLRKIEAGDRNFYWEYVSFCRYKGKVLNGLVKRRQVEYFLFGIF